MKCIICSSKVTYSFEYKFRFYDLVKRETAEKIVQYFWCKNCVGYSVKWKTGEKESGK